MKYFIYTVFFLGIFSSSIFSSIRYDLSEFSEQALFKGGIGFVQVDQNNFAKLQFSPDLNYKGFLLGLDLNGYVPMSGNTSIPSDLQSVVVRHIGFDYKNKAGFYWGRIRNLTMGYGQLVDRFDSGRGGTAELHNGKGGVTGYLSVYNLKLQGLWTASKLYGGRISYEIEALSVLSSPLTIGGTYVQDEDGLSEFFPGRGLLTRPKQEGYAVDIALPIGGDIFTLYTEYAELKNRGKGGASGFRGSLFDLFDYRAEYRLAGKGFVPGYFNSTYMSSSFNFETQALKEESSGVVAEGGVSFWENRLKAGVAYESYKDRSLLTSSLGFRSFFKTSGVLNYSQPFTGANNTILEADILYSPGGFWDYTFHLKRLYLDTGSFTETYGFSVGMNFDQLLPKTWVKQDQ